MLYASNDVVSLPLMTSYPFEIKTSADIGCGYRVLIYRFKGPVSHGKNMISVLVYADGVLQREVLSVVFH